MRRYSGKANTLRYINTKTGTPRDIVIKERKIDNIEIKIIPFIIYYEETVSLWIDKFKSKKAVSVSEAL